MFSYDTMSVVIPGFVFYGTIVLILFLCPTPEKDVITFLLETYSTERLFEYLKSFVEDERILEKMDTKLRLARFITNHTRSIRNTKQCDICYNDHSFLRVHKCTVCTLNLCDECSNKLSQPILCPQCNNIFNFHEISNIITRFGTESKRIDVIVTCFSVTFILSALLVFTCYCALLIENTFFSVCYN